MRHDVSVIGLYILDVLGRPVTRIPDRGNVDFIEEIRLTVAGTAGGTVVDTAKLGLRSLTVGAVGDVTSGWMSRHTCELRKRRRGWGRIPGSCRLTRRQTRCGSGRSSWVAERGAVAAWNAWGR